MTNCLCLLPYGTDGVGDDISNIKDLYSGQYSDFIQFRQMVILRFCTSGLTANYTPPKRISADHVNAADFLQSPSEISRRPRRTGYIEHSWNFYHTKSVILWPQRFNFEALALETTRL
ncbi:predicted protein [Histoplasma capsulatum G186AR]|uniref:Uncharacterized protein n=1 Tax=Ajellomyces capsulatus (strain G186AR / H82 / ATCC MYA-2454 / RMSCC 2432) TaxID=447093 RepID=C0NXN6_AJECG|nr:uncharacterized protein HCBG_08228 [Histoplasma capsulatum G186AR]EEH04102.1 predicted protein [Histoplasma capsulatum G186AR]